MENKDIKEKCSICGKKVTISYSAHPYIEHGKCCGECCAKKVLPFRLAYRYLFGYGMNKPRKQPTYMAHSGEHYNVHYSNAIYNALKHDFVFRKDLIIAVGRYMSFDYKNTELGVRRHNNWIVNSQYNLNPQEYNVMFAFYPTARGWITIYTKGTDTMIMFDMELHGNEDILLV